MKNQAYEKNQQWSDNIWKITLTLICIIIIGYDILYLNNTLRGFQLVGYNLAITLFISIIFEAIMSRLKIEMTGKSFKFIFISLMLGSQLGSSKYKSEEAKMVSEIKTQYSEFIKSPATPSLPINTAPKAKGEFGKIEKFIKEYFNAKISLKNDYLLELETLGWKNILNPNRIKKDKTFVESREIIQKAKETLIKYMRKNQIMDENIKTKFSALNINESFKKDFLIGFNKGEANRDKLSSLESKTLDEFENIINLLSENERWVINDEQILFYNDRDLKLFNSYIASIQNLDKQQEEIQSQPIIETEKLLNEK